jgi:hypothetical protein
LLSARIKKFLDNNPEQEYKESEEWLIKVVVLLFLFSAEGLGRRT